jgi:hypothetical protein
MVLSWWRSVEDACGADPLVRSRRPRRPATEIDKAPKSGSGGTRADQGVRPGVRPTWHTSSLAANARIKPKAPTPLRSRFGLVR